MSERLGDTPESNSSPLSFAQQRLWFLEQLIPGNVVYNVPSVLRLRGQLDVVALERSLGEIIRRHEVLRTSFEVEQGHPVQVIAPPETLRLEVVDLSGMEEVEREQTAQRLIEE